jgi:hypothetical protein
LQDNPYDDVLGWVPIKDIVADLADFFLRGGVIDGDDEETRKWIGKLEAQLNPEPKPELTPSGGPDDWNYFSFSN